MAAIDQSSIINALSQTFPQMPPDQKNSYIETLNNVMHLVQISEAAAFTRSHKTANDLSVSFWYLRNGDQFQIILIPSKDSYFYKKKQGSVKKAVQVLLWTINLSTGSVELREQTIIRVCSINEIHLVEQEFDMHRNLYTKMQDPSSLMDPPQILGSFQGKKGRTKCEWLQTHYPCNLYQALSPVYREQNCTPDLPYQNLFTFFKRLAHTLDELHKNQITHNDVSPPNILVSETTGFHLCDFGISTTLENEYRAKRHGIYSPISDEKPYSFWSLRRHFGPNSFLTDIWGLTISMMASFFPKLFHPNQRQYSPFIFMFFTQAESCWIGNEFIQHRIDCLQYKKLLSQFCLKHILSFLSNLCNDWSQHFPELLHIKMPLIISDEAEARKDISEELNILSDEPLKQRLIQRVEMTFNLFKEIFDFYRMVSIQDLMDFLSLQEEFKDSRLIYHLKLAIIAQSYEKKILEVVQPLLQEEPFNRWNKQPLTMQFIADLLEKWKHQYQQIITFEKE